MVCLQMWQRRHQRSFSMFWMLSMGSQRDTSSTVTSGSHWEHTQCAHSEGMVVGFRAPPVTGHRQHCAAGWSAPSSSQGRHRNSSSAPASVRAAGVRQHACTHPLPSGPPAHPPTPNPHTHTLSCLRIWLIQLKCCSCSGLVWPTAIHVAFHIFGRQHPFIWLTAQLFCCPL